MLDEKEGIAQNSMRIIQAVFGVFHHFELGRERYKRNHLQAIYSTWPWARLKREGLPRDVVKTFPWIHAPLMLLGRTRLQSRWLVNQLDYVNTLLFDSWSAAQICKYPAPDALIALSPSSLTTGQMLQQQGTVFVCDRACSHHRYQVRIVSDEFRRWGVNRPVSDIRFTLREEAIYDVADAISVPSTFAVNSFLEMGVKRSKIHLIPYGVRLENFHPTQDPPPISERFEVLFAGQIALRKGVPYLLEAFRRVRHPNKRLRMAGVIIPDIKDVLKRMPLERVEFMGPLPQPKLAEVMSTSHLLVLPSIEDGFGYVLAQAMACGCPIIGTTNTGAPDLISDGVEGFIVPVRDVPALTDRMQRIADDPDLQARTGAAALARVRFLGGWKDHVDRWEILLHQLTGK